MAVVSITILESGVEVVSGIPKTLTVSVSIPSTIYYTLDGTVPTTSSHVYLGPIDLPRDRMTVFFSVFATNGVDSSAIITEQYGPDVTEDRWPHAGVTGLTNLNSHLGPFGSNTTEGSAEYLSTAETGITTSSAGAVLVPSGWVDADGSPVGGTDLPLSSYQQIYTTTDQEGQKGPGIGTLPGNITVLPGTPQYSPEESKRSDRLFNPRAMVIFQDSALDNPTDPVQLNREFMSLENPEIVRDGALLFNNGWENQTTTGGFIRSFVNPRDNTITYYYYDNSVGRWLISKQPFVDSTPVDSLSSMVFGREKGIGRVHAWRLFARRVLT